MMQGELFKADGEIVSGGRAGNRGQAYGLSTKIASGLDGAALACAAWLSYNWKLSVTV